jgi:hypothetical protein
VPVVGQRAAPAGPPDGASLALGDVPRWVSADFRRLPEVTDTELVRPPALDLDAHAPGAAADRLPGAGRLPTDGLRPRVAVYRRSETAFDVLEVEPGRTHARGGIGGLNPVSCAASIASG